MDVNDLLPGYWTVHYAHLTPQAFGSTIKGWTLFSTWLFGDGSDQTFDDESWNIYMRNNDTKLRFNN